MSCLVLTKYSVTENVSVTASAFWLARLAIRLNWHFSLQSNYNMFMSLKYMLYTFIWYIWPNWLTQKWSRVMFTFQLLLLFRNWTLCRRLLVRFSLAPTLFIHFCTSTANGTEYLHLSAPTGSVLFFLVYHNSGQFFRGSHQWYDHREPVRQRLTQRRRVAVTWRDATQALQKEASHVTRQSRIPPCAVENSRDNHHNHFLLGVYLW